MTRSTAMALGLTIILVGCDPGREPPGVVYSDGQWMSDTAANARLAAEQSIDRSIDRDLGEHWRCVSQIAEVPHYAEDPVGDWRWDQATVEIQLIGDGATALPIATDDVQDAVMNYMRRRVTDPQELVVSVTQHVDPERFAALVNETADTTVRSMLQKRPGETRYTVQTSDTLAAISAAFYGTSQHWRRILDANPGVSAERLEAGMVLVIPARPSSNR
jgi:hypothetical protein